MTEEYRRNVIRGKLANQQCGQRASIPTGFEELDRALGIGGLPRGGLTELFGPPSVGKSTLALQWVAHLQAAGLTAAWIDADHTFDARYATFLGVSLEQLPLARPDSAEQALEIARRLVQSGAVDALVVDSAAALAPQFELEAGGPDLLSRALASGLKPLGLAVAKNDTAVLFLNQTRGRSGPDGTEETSAGGAPLKLHSTVRVVLQAGKAGTVHFRTLKNRASEAFRTGAVRLGKPRGVVKTQ